MNKTIVLMLAVLLVISIVFGVYFFQKNIKAERLLQEKTKELGLAQDKIKTLENEKATLQKNIDKGLAYIKSLDLLLEPMRQQTGLSTKIINEDQWLKDFLQSAKDTGDKTLENLAGEIQKGGTEAADATLRFLDGAVKSTIDLFK